MVLAAAPPPDAVRDRIIADAAASNPASLAFDRTTTSVRKGGGSTTRSVVVERWDGKDWLLISINGNPPTDAERQSASRHANETPVPGYHSLARLLAASSSSSTSDNGAVILQIPVLPPGSVVADGTDISRHLQAEAQLARRGEKVWVERVSVTARESFKISLFVKVTSFEQVSDYRLDVAGNPRLAAQSADSLGTLLGFPGGETRRVTYAYRQ